MLLTVVVPAGAAKAPKVCRQCKALCKAPATVHACVDADPRIASCSARKRLFDDDQHAPEALFLGRRLSDLPVL
jgi:hypothetical protein